MQTFTPMLRLTNRGVKSTLNVVYLRAGTVDKPGGRYLPTSWICEIANLYREVPAPARKYTMLTFSLLFLWVDCKLNIPTTVLLL